MPPIRTFDHVGITVADPRYGQRFLRDQGILDRLAADGYHPVGGVGEYEGVWRMASVRGPEGILVSLAQRID
jgi:catechol 2,3-dioxygenase-like lactoylglutathione lyase family enzyme